MQFRVIVAVVAGMLVAGPAAAFAAGSTKDKGSGFSSGGGGGGSEGGGGGAGGATDRSAEENYDRARGGASANKTWQVFGAVEYHHLLQPAFANGSAVNGAPDPGNGLNANVLYYLVGGYWEPTKLDRVSADWGLIQRLGQVRDSGEGAFGPNEGVDDALIAYTRTVPLPERVTLRITPRVDIGLSWESRNLTGLIAAPRLGVSVERDFGPINLFAETHGYWYGEKYTSYAGGNPTPETSLHARIEAVLTMPFHKRLSAGVTASTATTWFHQVHDSGNLVGANSTSDPQVPSQPFANTYGGEIFVRYVFPGYQGVGSDLLLAYANGDPTVTGYQSTLRDGVWRPGFFYRSVSEIYTELTVRY